MALLADSHWSLASNLTYPLQLDGGSLDTSSRELHHGFHAAALRGKVDTPADGTGSGLSALFADDQVHSHGGLMLTAAFQSVSQVGASAHQSSGEAHHHRQRWDPPLHADNVYWLSQPDARLKHPSLTRMCACQPIHGFALSKHAKAKENAGPPQEQPDGNPLRADDPCHVWSPYS